MINKNFVDKNLSNLIDCVKSASAGIMKIYRSDYFGQEEKSDGSPLTMADTISNEIIMDALEKISPDISVVSEENFSDENLKNLDETYWLVDPLDGTKEFINKTDEFTVNIALIENGRSVYGIVAAPVPNKTWLGSIFHKEGYDNNSSDVVRIVMSKSHKSSNDELFLEFLEKSNIKYKIVEKGSSLKLCTLSDNEADIYPRFGPTSEWDIAAAHAVLNSYGGSVINIENSIELSYSKTNSILNPYFICTRNDAIKDTFMPILGDFFKKLV